MTNGGRRERGGRGRGLRRVHVKPVTADVKVNHVTQGSLVVGDADEPGRFRA